MELFYYKKVVSIITLENLQQKIYLSVYTITIITIWCAEMI